MPIKESLNANPVTLGEIFSNGRRYVIPAFQRDYAWTHTEWLELWEDVVKLVDSPDSDSEHYLGAIVVQQARNGERSIVDGQQRLVTLSLLALAVIGHIQALAEAGVDAEANATRVRLLREKFVSTQSAASLQHHPRLRLNDNDNPFYRSYLVNGKTRRGLTGSNKRLSDALTFFRGKIEEQFRDHLDGETLAAFLDGVAANRLRFIEILVEDDETAFTVFETLNARGVALGTADLLKNYLFNLAAKGGRQDLELAATLWQQTVDRIPLDRLSKMLFHKLAGQVADLREKRVFAAVKARVPGQINVFDFLRQDVHETAEIYAALDDPLSSLWHEYPDARVHVGQMKLLRMTQARPLILAALPLFDEKRERLANLLRRVISVGVRAWIARLNTGDVQRAYHNAALGVFEGRLRSPRAMVAALRPIHVDDEQFRSAFAQLSLDPKGSRKNALRYLLSSLEAEESGRRIDFDAGDANIEHILPVNANDGWDEFSPEAKRQDANRLGNLTPLEYTLNHRLASQPFDTKRETYQASAFGLTRGLVAYERWTPAALRKRQGQMAEMAARVWSLEDATTSDG